MKKIFILLLFFLSNNLFAAGILFDDLSVTDSVKNLNLGGHSVIVEKSGVILEKCNNGEIFISSNVGPGMIILKNCNDVSVTLESGVNLLLDKKTKIRSLYIKNNVSVNSLESFQAELKNKKNNSKELPFIENVFLEENLSPVIQNVEVKRMQTVNTGNSEVSRKLNITQDLSYNGFGVRFLIANFPKEADCLYVMLYENGTEKEIEWISTEKNRDRFFLGYYDYEFLEADKETEFIFWYSKGTETLAKYYIKAKASKGLKVSFDKSKVALTADGESGLVSWVSVPQDIELPEESQLVYEIISLDSNYNWHFIGNCIKDWDDFSPVNLFEDFDWFNPEKLINNTIFLHVYFANHTFRWQIIKETEQFKINVNH